MALFVESNSRLWQEGQVPYVIDGNDFPPGSEYLKEVQDAISHWNTKTNIRLIHRSNERDYVLFKESVDVCNSNNIGRGGGPQLIACDLNSGNWGFGNVIHEIGHAVGLYHEQQRWDRDSNITYRSDKVKDGPLGYPDQWRANFYMQKKAIAIGPYDLGSIMHYGKCAFSIGGNSCSESDRTLVTNKPIGQRESLSKLDISAVRQIYADWKPASNGYYPSDALVGGYVEEDGERKPLYIVRATYRDGIHPGKLWKRWAHIPWGGEEVLIPSYQVLCEPGADFQWINARDGNAPENAFIGGYVNSVETDNCSKPLIIVRAFHRNGIHIGKLWKRWAHIPWGEKEILISQYEVLCLKS